MPSLPGSRCWSNVSNTVAAVDTAAAVELLEQGRAVLWSQALERFLTADLTASHPAVAARFEAIATALS